jgi:hypothetical protein
VDVDVVGAFDGAVEVSATFVVDSNIDRSTRGFEKVRAHWSTAPSKSTATSSHSVTVSLLWY